MNITGTNPIEVIASINAEANYLIFVSILFLLWIIIFFRNNNEPSRDAASGATFITALVGLLFAVLGFVGDRTFSIAFFGLLAVLALLINRPDGQ